MLLLIVSYLSIEEILHFAHFLLVQVFLGLVPIYSASEIIRHFVFRVQVE